MPPGLANPQQAGAIFLRSQIFNYTQARKWGSHSASCSAGSGTGYDWLYCGGPSGEPISAAFIASDDANCIAYYHLVGISCLGLLRDITQGCCGNPFPIPGTNPVTLVNTGTPGSSQGIALNDGGSDASPFDGTKHYTYDGYPVCAAVIRDAANAYAFAAGAATALSLAAAIAACGTSGLSLCQSGTDESDVILNALVRVS